MTVGRRGRTGFTLIELLVSLGIASLVLSMALPAIESSRESARRAQCANHLKQLGLAAANFEATHGHFPGVGGYSSETTMMLAGVPTVVRTPLPFSTQYFLLPHLEQIDVYRKVDRTEVGPLDLNPPASATNQWALTKAISVFVCPSDSVRKGGCSYRRCNGNSGNSGSRTVWDPTEVHNTNLSGWPSWDGSSVGRILDGISNTVFFSERIVGDENEARYSPVRDVAYILDVDISRPDNTAQSCQFSLSTLQGHFSFAGATWLYSGTGNEGYNHVLNPNSTTPDCAIAPNGSSIPSAGAISARSVHPGGVNVCLGDGAVRFVADGIDLKLWRALATIAGQESVSGF